MGHVHCSSQTNSSKVSLSLVEVQPSTTGNNFIQVYMVDAGFPVLGDPLYDYRARSMLGYQVKLTTSHTAAKRSQILPPVMLDLMGLKKGEEWMVPRMVHLHRLHLDSWLGKDTHLTVFAPPPDHFRRTCKTLGINLDYKALAERDTLISWDTKPKKKNKNSLVVPEIIKRESESSL